MWSVKENFKNTVISLANVGVYAYEMTSLKIEALVEANPAFTRIFQKSEKPEILEVEEELIKAPVKKKK